MYFQCVNEVNQSFQPEATALFRIEFRIALVSLSPLAKSLAWGTYTEKVNDKPKRRMHYFFGTVELVVMTIAPGCIY